MSGRGEGKGEFGRGAPWRIIAGVLVIAIVVGAVLWFRPWEASGGTVRFDYRAMFIYLGSEDNEPLENLALRFPAPQVENGFAGEISSAWQLYYMEDDNSLTLQANAVGIYSLRGFRSSQLVIYTSGLENSEYGPMLTWEIDRLYPREVFMDLGWAHVSKEKDDTVTLSSYGDSLGESLAYWHAPKFQEENKRIDFSFAAGLYHDNMLVELYELVWENEDWGWYYLPKTV